MAKEDYYATLGIDREAGEDEIKKAYRRLAMKHHPDRNPDNAAAEQKFKDASEAYDVLKDEQKRAAYDRFGHAAFEQGGPGGGGPGGGGFASGFADIFDEMFGEFGNRGGGGNAHGSDLRYNMEISLADAYQGKSTEIRVTTSVACDACDGSGSEGGAPATTCPSCRGHGRIRAQSGFFTVERTCPSCQGTGQIIRSPCGTCGATGRVQKDKTLSVTIPPGVEDGTRIRLSGEGQAGLRGAPSGDLYIFLSIRAHRIFQRDGADILCRVPIPMATAALGGAVEVPTVDGGRARINIPSGTQTGNRFRLKGKGMSILRSKSRGDMFVHTVIETPVNLNKEQKDLLKNFQKKSTDEKHNPESHGFFSKVKELWEDLKE